ncbi:hypothetical protein STEG23_007443 [Scotinomys teguina]
MAWKAGQGKKEEESRARQQEGKTPVREEEKTPACDGRGHHVVEPDNENLWIAFRLVWFDQPRPPDSSQTAPVKIGPSP